MPVHNAERWIEPAVKSILGQTYPALELVVVDDGSTDTTIRRLATFQDPRLRIIRNRKTGFIPTVSTGIQEAKGEWIARMDADDVAHPLRLEVQKSVVDQNEHTVLCATGFGYFSRGGKILRRPMLFHQRQMKAEHITRRNKMFADATMLFRRETALNVGLYDSEFSCNELSLWYKLLGKGTGIEIGKCLYFQRIHSDGMNIGRLDASSEAVAVRMKYDPNMASVKCVSGSSDRSKMILFKGMRNKLRIFRTAGDMPAVVGLLGESIRTLPLKSVMRLLPVALTGKVKLSSGQTPFKTKLSVYQPESLEIARFLRNLDLNCQESK